MRVTLMHNPVSGEADHEREELVALLEGEGHEVRYVSRETAGWQQALREPADLVVAAGGDGTVTKVFKQLAGLPTPVAILPCGTANNIAASLGLAEAEVEELVRRWPTAATRPYDICEAAADGASARFVEGMGGGLFAALFERAEELGDDSGGDAKIELSLRLLQTLLTEAEACQVRVELDGRDLSGRYVAVEAMNARMLGPNVPLAPEADVSDGRLDVVLAEPGHVDALAAYVEGRLAGAEPEPPPLRVCRGRTLRLERAQAWRLHVDDEPWPDGTADGHAEVAVTTSVRVLGASSGST